jgi:hypothetical protein
MYILMHLEFSSHDGPGFTTSRQEGQRFTSCHTCVAEQLQDVQAVILGRKRQVQKYFDIINDEMAPMPASGVLYHCRRPENNYQPMAWLSTSLTIEGARHGSRSGPEYQLFRMIIIADDVKGIVVRNSDIRFEEEKEVLLGSHLDIRFNCSEEVTTTQFVIEPHDPDVKVIVIPQPRKKRVTMKVTQVGKD